MSINGESCQRCKDVLTNSILEGILDRIKDGVHENCTLAYQPIGGLIELVRKKNTMLDSMRFMKLTASRKLVTRARTIDDYKKFVLALSEPDGKVKRLDALIRAGLKRGASVRGMFELLDRANKGLYRPKSFTEEEMLRSVLFLRLGGSRVAGLAHRALGTPGVSTLRRSSEISPLLATAGRPTKSTLQRNIRAALKTTDEVHNAYGFVLMIDEIKVEERLRWDPTSNDILGLCREHTAHLGLEFGSVNNAKALIKAILDGECHHAKEVSFVPIVSIQFQICRLVETPITNPDVFGNKTGQTQWRWNRLMDGAMIKTKGSCIQAVDPDIKLEKVGEPFYVFTTDELRALAAALFNTISMEERSRLPCLRKRTDNFPYRSGGT